MVGSNALQVQESTPMESTIASTILEKMPILDIRHFLVSWYPVARKNEPTELG